MAAKKDDKKSDNGAAAKAPAGFQLTQAADRYWWSPLKEDDDTPNPIQGIATSRIERHDGDGYLYIFRLTAPTMAKDGDGVWSERKPGELVCVDERHQLSSLKDQMNACPTLLEFFLQPLGKRDIDGGRSVHRFNVFAKPTSEVRPRLPAPAPTGELVEDTGGPIPF